MLAKLHPQVSQLKSHQATTFSPELKTRPNLLQLYVLSTVHLLEVVVAEWDKVVVVGKSDDSLTILLHQYHERLYYFQIKTKTFGTGKRYLRMFIQRSPSLVLKLWKTRCGAASLTLPMSGMSCLITMSVIVKYAVGPCGRWHTTRPSGTPRCSWTTRKSVTAFAL